MKKFLALSLSDVVGIMLINVKMLTIVGILTFMSRINFVLRWVKHGKICNQVTNNIKKKFISESHNHYGFDKFQNSVNLEACTLSGPPPLLSWRISSPRLLISIKGSQYLKSAAAITAPKIKEITTILGYTIISLSPCMLGIIFHWFR